MGSDKLSATSSLRAVVSQTRLSFFFLLFILATILDHNIHLTPEKNDRIYGSIKCNPIMQLAVFCKREILGDWAFEILLASFCVIVHVSMDAVSMRHFLYLQVGLLKVSWKKALLSRFQGKCL